MQERLNSPSPKSTINGRLGISSVVTPEVSGKNGLGMKPPGCRTITGGKGESMSAGYFDAQTTMTGPRLVTTAAVGTNRRQHNPLSEIGGSTEACRSTWSVGQTSLIIESQGLSAAWGSHLQREETEDLDGSVVIRTFEGQMAETAPAEVELL